MISWGQTSEKRGDLAWSGNMRSPWELQSGTPPLKSTPAPPLSVATRLRWCPEREQRKAVYSEQIYRRQKCLACAEQVSILPAFVLNYLPYVLTLFGRSLSDLYKRSSGNLFFFKFLPRTVGALVVSFGQMVKRTDFRTKGTLSLFANAPWW